MTQQFLRVMDIILGYEGGYSNDPNDPGGETNYGITKRSYPHLDIKNLSKEQALAIYHEDYWERIGGDSLAFPEALALMDYAVNSGVSRAMTHWALARDVWELQEMRVEYLTSLKQFDVYGRGWMRRVSDVTQHLHKATTPTDVEYIVLYAGDKEITLEPVKVSVGPSRSGRRKLMARLW